MVVLMLFLQDRGEGHINPALTAFLKEENSIVPSGHLSIRPRRPSPSTRLFTPREGLALGVCLVTLNNARSTPNPHIALSTQKKITPLPLPVVLQSPSLNPLSFCVAVIYSNTISLSSSSSSCSYSSLRFSNPPHHPPIIFRALS